MKHAKPKLQRLQQTFPSATQANIPQLESDPAAPARIFLDFTGSDATSWDGRSVPQTPAYDTDGNPSSFSPTEVANIREIWSRVAEKFSPFDLDVTTVDPGVYLKGQTLRVVVGGDGAWTGGAYGGYSIPGGFLTDTPTSWIFPVNLNGGSPRYVAEAIAHEAGHDFGLEHQSVFSGSTKIGEYNSGSAQEAPVMGTSYYATRGVWWEGPNSSGEDQDDMAVIAGPGNGFGYRPEDHGQTIGTADALAMSGGLFSASGVISTTGDADFLSFNLTDPSSVTFTAAVASFGPMLHLKLILLDSSGDVIRAADSSSLGQSLSAQLPAGSYRIEVASHGAYGDVGQYILSGMAAKLVLDKHGSASLAYDRSGLTARVVGSRVRLDWSPQWVQSDNSVKVERSNDGGTTWSPVTGVRRAAARFIRRVAVGAPAVYSYRIVCNAGATPSAPVLVFPASRGDSAPHR